MKKRILSLAMAASLLLVFVPLTVYAHHNLTSYKNEARLGLYFDSNGNLVYGWHYHRSSTPTPKSKPKAKIYPTSVSVMKPSKKIYVGDSIKLYPSYKPSNTTVTSVTWRSSNNKTAKISASGTLKALKIGRVTVTVKTSNGKASKRTIAIIERKANSIKLKSPPSKIGVGESKKLKAAISPAKTTNKAIRWKSSNSKVLSVDKNGTIKALEKGNATITATTSNGKKVQKEIEVYATAAESIHIQGLPNEFFVGDTFKFHATILPSTTKNKKYTVTFSNPSMVEKVATDWDDDDDDYGNGYHSYKLIAPGELTVTVTASNGIESSASFTVHTPEPQIKLTQGVNPVVVNNKSYTVSGSVTSRNESRSKLNVSINDEVVSLEYNDAFSKTLTLVEGLNTITIKAVNTYGKETIVTKEVTFTPPVPSVTVDQGTNAVTVNSKSYTISGKAADTNDNRSKLNVSINEEVVTLEYNDAFSKTLTLVEGLNTITIKAVNTYGKETIVTKEVTFTPPVPSVTVDQGANAVTVNNKSYTISGKATDTNDSRSKLNVSINEEAVTLEYNDAFSKTLILVEGLNTITIKAVNTYGKETIVTKEVTFTPPVPSVTVDQGTNAVTVNSKSYTISGKATDTNDSRSKLNVSINEELVTLEYNDAFSKTLTLVEGLNTITIKAVNTYGKETIVTKEVTFTPPVPSVTVDQGANAVTVNYKSYTISGKATDTNDSRSKLNVSINEEAVTLEYNDAFSKTLTLVEGLNTITIKAVNTYGKETIVTKNVTFTPPVPSVTVDQGVNAVTVNYKSFTISGKATDVNDSRSQLKVYINDELVTLEYNNAFSKTLTLVEGLNTITIKAVNTYGKETIFTKNVTFTPPVPSVTVDQGANAVTVNYKSYTISGKATDANDNRSQLKVSINNELVTLEYNNAFSKTLTLVEGLNTITIKAVNTYGKETIFTKNVTFTPLS